MGVLHGAACIVVWSRVIEGEKAAARQFRDVWVTVVLAVGSFAWLAYIAVTEVDWIRLLFCQLALWCFPLTLSVNGTEQKNRDRAAIGRRALSGQYNAALTPAQLFESGKWQMLRR